MMEPDEATPLLPVSRGAEATPLFSSEEASELRFGLARDARISAVRVAVGCTMLATVLLAGVGYSFGSTAERPKPSTGANTLTEDILSIADADANCTANWGKCGGGVWSDPYSHTCCDPDYTCYWKRDSAVKNSMSAYAQCRPTASGCPDGWECTHAPIGTPTSAPSAEPAPAPTAGKSTHAPIHPPPPGEKLSSLRVPPPTGDPSAAPSLPATAAPTPAPTYKPTKTPTSAVPTGP